MKNIAKKEKLFVLLLSILLLIVIPLVSYIFFVPKFQINDFQDVLEVSWQQPFSGNPGYVCYGNLFSCSSVSSDIEGEVDIKKLGENEITYVYNYHGNIYKKKQKVLVVDREVPIIQTEKNKFRYCENGNVEIRGIKAYDNYDGDVTDQLSTIVKDGKVYFSVSDSSGNNATTSYEGEQVDSFPLEFMLNGPEIMYLNLNETYNEQGAVANDVCEGNLSQNIEIVSNVDTSKPGKYTVNYKLKDKKGNDLSIKRSVIVEDKKNINSQDKKKIYLTFDDGPSRYTEHLLDILKKYNAKATFFVTNQRTSYGYDNVIKRAYLEGHTVGLHTFSHDYSIYKNEETFFEDLYAIQEKVKEITGEAIWIMRFPGGSSNTISKSYDGGSHIMSKLVKAVEEKGFQYYDWNILSGDAGETKNTEEIVSNVIREFGKFNTPIVLQHDVKDYSVDAVEAILEYGTSHGYQFEAITKDTPLVHHHVNN